MTEWSAINCFYRARLRVFLAVMLVAVTALSAQVSHAHVKGENYVWINVEKDYINGRFEIHRNDLKGKLGIDIDSIGDTRIEGLQASQAEVQEYLLENMSIEDANGEMQIEFTEATIIEENESFVAYPFRINALPVDNEIRIKNTIFLTPDLMVDDRLHRSVAVVEYNEAAGKEFGSENVALVFSPKKSDLTVDLSNPPSILVWTEFLWQGFLHIIIGLDHLVFILLILLMVVLRRDGDTWSGEPKFSGVFWNALKVITTFTIAHTVTLSLAALGFLTVNSAVVETIIALSILVLAITNIFPVRGVHSLFLIFVFGLFHGLGFASVMGDLQFRTVLMERISLLCGRFLSLLGVWPFTGLPSEPG